MDELAILELASRTYAEKMLAVTNNEWACGSTCAEWTVRDVCDHVIGGNRFSVASLAGLALDAAFAEAIGPGFAGEPLEMYLQSAEDQLQAFSRPNALRISVDHPMGQISGSEFLGYRICDLVLHAWDVARSTGANEHIDGELATFAYEQFADDSRRIFESGSYGLARVRDDESAFTTWDAVLIMSGRTP